MGFRRHLPTDLRPALERGAQGILSLTQEALSATSAYFVGKREIPGISLNRESLARK